MYRITTFWQRMASIVQSMRAIQRGTEYISLIHRVRTKRSKENVSEMPVPEQKKLTWEYNVSEQEQ